MKVIIPFLLILVPAIWFYIKVFSKKATVYLDGNMFISNLYEALINSDIEKARKLYNSFSIKAMRDPNYILFLQNLPPNHKNKMCLSFINSEMEITEKTQSRLIDLYIDNIKEKNIAETEASIKADIDSGAFAQVGRNEPCPCRSGKRYKDCHGKIS